MIATDNALLSHIARKPLTRAEQFALVCDYLRSRENPADYINDAVGIAQVGVPIEVQTIKANRILDTMEAMNFAALGEQIAQHLVDAYLQKALDWKAEQRTCELPLYPFGARAT